MVNGSTGCHAGARSAPDRHDPAALEWLRRWTPNPAHLITPACACAAGRCGICN